MAKIINEGEAYLLKTEFENCFNQSKYYPQYRKIIVSKNTTNNKGLAYVEYLHEKFHRTLGLLSSGNIIYGYWQILRVLVYISDVIFDDFLRNNRGIILSRTFREQDYIFSENHPYIELSKLCVHIYKTIKILIGSTEYVQEGASTYVSLNAGHFPSEFNEFLNFRDETRRQIVNDGYKTALKIAEKWSFDKYAVQDTAKMVLDYPYFDEDLLSMSEEEVSNYVAKYDSKTRWEKLLYLDESLAKSIVAALESQDQFTFFALCDIALGTKCGCLSYESWKQKYLFENPRILSVLKRNGITGISPNRLRELYNSEEVLINSISNKRILLYYALVLPASEKKAIIKSILDGFEPNSDPVFMTLLELADKYNIERRVCHFSYVVHFREYREMEDRYKFIRFVGKKNKLVFIQNAINEVGFEILVPVEYSSPDNDSYFSPDYDIQLIVAISGSNNLVTLITEIFKDRAEALSIKHSNNELYIELTNATYEDIEEMITLIKENPQKKVVESWSFDNVVKQVMEDL